jgi:hypothetical protein
MVTPTTEFDARDHEGLRAKEKDIIALSLSLSALINQMDTTIN